MSPAPFPAPTAKWHTDTYAAIDLSGPELSLARKTVVITGGGASIGGAIARSFAKAGASKIAIVGRRENVLLNNKAKMAALVGAFHQDTHSSYQYQYEGRVDHAFETIAAKFGTPDILVNSTAYFGGPHPILQDSIDEWFRAFEVNAEGTYLISRAFLANAVPRAHVLNISSGVAHLPAQVFPGYSAYAASKIATVIFFNRSRRRFPSAGKLGPWRARFSRREAGLRE
jgi:NAD(P)-dependent dehydrogenase (short-subunit alcohol dehydrogenase family)